MSYRSIAITAALSLSLAMPLGAQSEPTIDPGMSRADVIERLGKPLNERKTGNSWFMFYRTGCERTCGMNDLVILEDDKVVDAIFRSPSRHYSAESSSPTGVKPQRSAGDGSSATAIERVRKAGRGGLVMSRPAGDSAAAGRRATVTGVDVTGAPAQTPPEAAGAPLPGAAAPSGTSAAGGGSGGGANFGGTAGGNAAQVTTPGGNSPQTGSPDASAPAARRTGQRPIIPVPLPGAKINPADSVRALTPDRPTAIPGAKINPADSVRAEAIRKQQADTTRKPD
jgi:hypothetical protein